MKENKVNPEGKPDYTIIPITCIRAAEIVLSYGAQKYGRESYKTWPIEKFKQAMLRHILAYLEDPEGLDEDSKMPHYYHILANAIIIVDKQEREKKDANK